MASATNKNAKRRAARQRAKSAPQSPRSPVPNPTSPMPTQASHYTQPSSQRPQAAPNPATQQPSVVTTGHPVATGKPGNSNYLTRAQLELKIAVARGSLAVEQAFFNHWKQALDKHDPALTRIAILSKITVANTWNTPAQPAHLMSYDHALAQDMLNASHREVRKLEKELWGLEQRLKESL